jgi:serine/threonine protein kinase
MVEHQPLIGGRYQCGPVIGRGGVAEVCAGRDTRLDRPVAIKFLRSEMDGHPAVRRRFEAEARLAARLIHPNVVTVFDSGEHATRPFIVMERLPGWTLRHQLDRGPMTVPAVRTLAGDVLGALAAAHAAGIVHRDIKPGNILLGPDGEWKVADFGIAKIAEVATSDDTATGLVIGTPAYLAPERFFGANATVEADLYALGAVLYEALTGRKPIQAPHQGAWATIAASTPPAPLKVVRPEVDTAMADAIDRCLKKDPAERFRSATEMTAALSSTSPEVAGPAVATATSPLESTRPLPSTERPAGRPWARRRRGIGAIAVLAVVGILATIIALDTSGGSARSTHRPPVPSTTPARTTSPAPPPTTATSPAASISPASTGPASTGPASTGPASTGPASTAPTKGPPAHARAAGHRHQQQH